ncbi:MAG: phosphatase PAP2 family protein [Gammaproteobacteria bacterium]|jgi:membrane-associated phospholipid phosphatase
MPDLNQQQEPTINLAGTLSRTLSPWVVGPLTIWLTAWAGTHDAIGATRWAALVIGVCVLPLFLFVLLQVQSGKMTDIHVGIRQQRDRLFFIAILLMTAMLAILSVTASPASLLPLLLSMLLSMAINACINLRSKISLHAAAFSGATVVSASLFGTITLALMLPLLLLVMWSRVRLGQHTRGQVIAGALVSASVTATVFAILRA